MNRLTKKLHDNDYTTVCGANYFDYNGGREEVLNKLGKLEDIEEELGIDLVTLFKALKHGFVYFIDAKVYEQCEIKYFSSLKEFVILNKRTSHFCKLKDYGKTWTLTEQELEK